MPKYVIERTLPNAGKLTPQQLHEISAKSNGVISEMAKDVQWVHSYVTGDKLYCVYNAKNADVVREHAKCGGFPCDSVNEVKAIIDPTTGEKK